MKKLAFLALVLFFSDAFAQTSYKGLQFNCFPGFLIAHREYMANMEAHAFGFELQYSSDNTGWKQVTDHYKHLKWGTGFSFFNLGNPKINGNVYAWHIHLEANLRKRKHFQSSLRFGSGIGYFNNPYHFSKNKTNKAIGSRLNGNIQLMYNTYFDVSKKSQIVLGLGITHYSNGNFKRPNLGINVAHWSLGWLQKLKIEENKQQIILPQLFPKNGFEFLFGFANKQIAVADTRRFTILSSSLIYYFKHNETRNWRFGTDVFYDKTYPYELFRPDKLKNVKLKDMTEIAFKVGHEFVFGRIAVVTDLGVYAYRPSDYKKRTYFKIGFNYFFNKGIVAQTRLKSHMAVADYFHWGVGYRFKNPISKHE